MAVIDHTIRWTAPERHPEVEKTLCEALRIPPIVAAVLASRGITDLQEADKYLHPSLDDLGDPKKLPDYISARDHILGARERGETIFVHGDYDVDGVTSAALLTRFLQSVGCKVITHVPHRMKEGYGIHLNAVDAAIATGSKLFLTCDCGVSAFEQIDRAREAGMAVVVTDHHSIGAGLPRAHAIINPHRTDSDYPYQELSGVGVAFRLCEGLTADLGYSRDRYRRAFLDLTVLGTVADVMPLTGENRIITRHGLINLIETQKVGIQALLHESKVLDECNGRLRAWHIGFMLGPRLNAAGRIDDAARSLDLLLTKDQSDASEMAKTIEGINMERRVEMKRIVDEAVEKVLECEMHKRFAIVIGHEAWHPGIIGLVAGRLAEQFRRPSFVVSIDSATGIAKGSARSIPGFNLAEVIRAHPELVQGGGHAMAAGFSTTVDLLEQIADSFDKYASERLTPEDFEVVLTADAELAPSEVSLSSVEALDLLEPYGCENLEPLFFAKGMSFVRIMPTKNPAHSRVTLRAGEGPIVQGMAFSQGERLAEMEPGFLADVLFQAKVNEWRGSRSLKWEIRHFEPTSTASAPL